MSGVMLACDGKGRLNDDSIYPAALWHALLAFKLPATDLLQPPPSRQGTGRQRHHPAGRGLAVNATTQQVGDWPSTPPSSMYVGRGLTVKAPSGVHLLAVELPPEEGPLLNGGHVDVPLGVHIHLECRTTHRQQPVAAG
jgi:hypothetical protein